MLFLAGWAHLKPGMDICVLSVILFFAFSVDGGWTEWTTLNDTCIQINDTNIWGKPKYRNCSLPPPKWGGNECNSGIGLTENSYDLCPPGKNIFILSTAQISLK